MTQPELPFGRRPLVRIGRVDPRDRPRLSAQAEQILDRLRRGLASNYELSEIALKYTSRISDLRAAGYDVAVCGRDYRSGVTYYEIREAA